MMHWKIWRKTLILLIDVVREWVMHCKIGVWRSREIQERDGVLYGNVMNASSFACIVGGLTIKILLGMTSHLSWTSCLNNVCCNVYPISPWIYLKSQEKQPTEWHKYFNDWEKKNERTILRKKTVHVFFLTPSPTPSESLVSLIQWRKLTPVVHSWHYSLLTLSIQLFFKAFFLLVFVSIFL